MHELKRRIMMKSRRNGFVLAVDVLKIIEEMMNEFPSFPFWWNPMETKGEETEIKVKVKDLKRLHEWIIEWLE